MNHLLPKSSILLLLMLKHVLESYMQVFSYNFHVDAVAIFLLFFPLNHLNHAKAFFLTFDIEKSNEGDLAPMYRLLSMSTLL